MPLPPLQPNRHKGKLIIVEGIDGTYGGALWLEGDDARDAVAMITASPSDTALGPIVRFLPRNSRSAVLKPPTVVNVPASTSYTSTLPVPPTGTHTRACAASYAM